MIVNNAVTIESLLAQMEQWSILCNMLNYIQYNKNLKNFHKFTTVNICKNHSDVKEEIDMIEVDFGPTLNILKEEYLDIYEGIKSEIVNTARFDEDSNLSTT